MFGSKKKTKVTTQKNNSNDNFSANTIQNGTIIEGQIKSESSIRIDGVLNGTIETKAKLVIGKTGKITGDVICHNASIEGQIVGQVNVQDLLHLKSTATINGDILTKKLVVDEGASFDGSCKMESAGLSKNIGKQEVKHKKAV